MRRFSRNPVVRLVLLSVPLLLFGILLSGIVFEYTSAPEVSANTLSMILSWGVILLPSLASFFTSRYAFSQPKISMVIVLYLVWALLDIGFRCTQILMSAEIFNMVNKWLVAASIILVDIVISVIAVMKNRK